MTTRKPLIAFLVCAIPIHFANGALWAQDFATSSSWQTPLRSTSAWALPPANRSAYDARFQPVTYRVERDPRVSQTIFSSPPGVPYGSGYGSGYSSGVNYGNWPVAVPPIAPISYSQPAGGGWGPSWQTQPNPLPGSCGQSGYPAHYGGYPHAAIPAPYYGSPLPRGYHKGDGLFGKDTVYADGQPLRNLFRFLAP